MAACSLPRRPHLRLQPGPLGGQLTEPLAQDGDVPPEPFRFLRGPGGGDPAARRRQLPAGAGDGFPGLAQPPGGRLDPAPGLIDPGGTAGQRAGEAAGHPDPRGRVDRALAACAAAGAGGQGGQEPAQREPVVGPAGHVRSASAGHISRGRIGCIGEDQGRAGQAGQQPAGAGGVGRGDHDGLAVRVQPRLPPVPLRDDDAVQQRRGGDPAGPEPLQRPGGHVVAVGGFGQAGLGAGEFLLTGPAGLQRVLQPGVGPGRLGFGLAASRPSAARASSWRAVRSRVFSSMSRTVVRSSTSSARSRSEISFHASSAAAQ